MPIVWAYDRLWKTRKNWRLRGNILKGALFKFILPVGALVLILSVWWVWRFLHPEAPKSTAQTEAKTETKDRPPAKAPDANDEWHIVGYFDFGNGVNFYLHNGNGSRVLVHPPNFKLTAYTAEVLLPSGEAVTSWTGGKSRAGLIDQATGGK